MADTGGRRFALGQNDEEQGFVWRQMREGESRPLYPSECQIIYLRTWNQSLLAVQ